MSSYQELRDNFEKLLEASHNYFTVTDVARIFHYTRLKAKAILEVAVRAGIIDFEYHVRCKTCQRVIGHYHYKFDIPDYLECDANDEHAGFELNRDKATIQKVYLPK